MRIRANKYLSKLIESSKKIAHLSPIEQGLSLQQIEWRFENSSSILGLIGTSGIFGNVQQLILLRKEDGQYVLFAPATRRDKYPCYLYDILNIEEFIKQYPIQPLFQVGNEDDVDELYDQLEGIKGEQTRGFIELENNEIRIYELA